MAYRKISDSWQAAARQTLGALGTFGGAEAENRLTICCSGSPEPPKPPKVIPTTVERVPASFWPGGVLRGCAEAKGRVVTYGQRLSALTAQCPDRIEADDWQQSIEDGRRFLARWAEQAAALGWRDNDLFGLHNVPDTPAPSYRRLSRRDQSGLIWLLRGRPVVALTTGAAAIQNPTGAITLYRRYLQQ
jgi:hypothetical protein